MESDEQVRTDSPSALESAIQDIERSLRSEGSGGRGIPDGELAGFEWRALFAWADKTGHVIDPALAPESIGGREHDVTYLEKQGRWQKFTKLNGCGLWIELSDSQLPMLLPATPLQYLKRLRLQNSFWLDDITLHGVQRLGNGAKIVTSQTDVAGEPPSPEHLDYRLRNDFKFARLNIPPMGYYKSLSYLKGNTLMCDVHPANFVEIAQQELVVPIDVIMIELDKPERVFLEKHIAAPPTDKDQAPVD